MALCQYTIVVCLGIRTRDDAMKTVKIVVNFHMVTLAWHGAIEEQESALSVLRGCTYMYKHVGIRGESFRPECEVYILAYRARVIKWP